MVAVRLIAVCGWLALYVASASARDLFVNNLVGNNSDDGARAVAQDGSGPLRTLQRALRLVEPGDRIVLGNTGQP